MISRCPSCGSPTREDEQSCASCGWDFVARKRVSKAEPAPPEKKNPPEETVDSSTVLDLDVDPAAPAKAEGVKPAERREPETPREEPVRAAEPSPWLSETAAVPKAEHIAVPLIGPARPSPEEEADPEELSLPEAPRPADPRRSLVAMAAIAGAALGMVSLTAVYFLARPAPSVSKPPVAPAPDAPPSVAAPSAVSASSNAAPSAPTPAVASSSGAPAAAPAPETPRPTASFGSAPHAVVAGQEPKPAAKPAPPEAPAKPRAAKRPNWTFEGTVFDLLTTRGVFGATLVFSNAAGKVVGQANTGQDGRYKISLPAGAGYQLKISHGDYADRYLDEGDATSSLREATPAERRILMSAAARNLPWSGDPQKTVRRDLALVPRAPEDQ